MASFLPTIELLRHIAKALDRQPSDPAVVELFRSAGAARPPDAICAGLVGTDPMGRGGAGR